MNITSRSCRCRHLVHVVSAILLLFVICILVPAKAHAGLADIVTFLTNITNTLQNDVGSALGLIRQASTVMAETRQVVVWPEATINDAKSLVLRTEAQYAPALNSIRQLPINSATLADTSRFEAAIRSQSVGNLTSVAGLYSKVYQPIPATSAASVAQRNLADIDDSLTMGALKQTIAMEQGSIKMLSFADQLGNKSAGAAPGSASLLSAEAQLASLQMQAQFLKTLAADLRVEAGQLAHDNGLLKQRAQNTQELNNHIQKILSKP